MKAVRQPQPKQKAPKATTMRTCNANWFMRNGASSLGPRRREAPHQLSLNSHTAKTITITIAMRSMLFMTPPALGTSGARRMFFRGAIGLEEGHDKISTDRS